MKFRWLQTILAVLVGATWATAQGQNPPGSVPTPTQPTIINPMPATELTAEPSGGGAEFVDDGHPQYSLFGYGQMLFWNVRDANLPILVNSVPVGFVPVTSTQTVNGAASTVTTPLPITILASPRVPGASDIDTSNHVGVRAGAGIWFGDSNEWGFELSGFGLEEKSQGFRLNNANSPQTLSINSGINNVVVTTAGIIGTPAVVTQTTPLIFPRQAFAAATGQFSTSLWGMEANVLRKGYYYGNLLISGLTGIRYQEFEENASLTNSVTLTRPAGVADPAGSNFPNPLVYTTFDRITSKNKFYGVQVGVETDLVYSGFFFNAKGKVALGDVRQEITVLGMTSFTGTVAPLMNTGGLLSGPGDQGRYTRDRVGFLPEINVKAGYRFGDCVRIHIGYDVLYMQHVVRPGGQTQLGSLNTQLTVANTNATFNAVQPVIQMRDMDVWVQGINGGIELRY